VVYGSSWSYPTYYYPPMYAPYPPGYGLMTFGVGMAVGAAIWGDCDWGWGDTDIDIDVDRYNEFNRNTSRNSERYNIERGQGGRGSWQHNPEHRKGVNYRNQGVAQQYGARAGSNRVTRDQARGWSGAQGGSRASAGTMDRGRVAGAADRSRAPSAGTMDRGRAAAGASRPSASTRQAGPPGRSTASTRQAGSYGSPSRSRDSAFSGARSPSADRAASSRGASSRSAGARGGGSRSVGGGRRR
jgi:hypothetical protein